MLIQRVKNSMSNASVGTLLLEMLVLILGILLALAADRWNQSRLDAIETAQIVARLRSDTDRNLNMFDRNLPSMRDRLANLKTLFRALEAGDISDGNAARIESGIALIDVVPSLPVVFAGYDELVATGRLRQLNDPVLIDLLGSQRAVYEAGQAVIGYWRDSLQNANNSLDGHVDYYFTSSETGQPEVGVRFDISEMLGDRVLKNNIFEAVDIHGDWLQMQITIYEITKKIRTRLKT